VTGIKCQATHTAEKQHKKQRTKYPKKLARHLPRDSSRTSAKGGKIQTNRSNNATKMRNQKKKKQYKENEKTIFFFRL